MQNFTSLADLYSCEDWFKCGLVTNPEDRVSLDEAKTDLMIQQCHLAITEIENTDKLEVIVMKLSKCIDSGFMCRCNKSHMLVLILNLKTQFNEQTCN